MRNLQRTILALIVPGAILLSACSADELAEVAEGIADAEDELEDALTVAAGTIEAELTQNAAESEADEGEAVPDAATATLIPIPDAVEPVPPAAATQTSVATCTDIVSFVADLTVPDGTEFAPGAGFTKTWRLENAGTCTWTSGYQVVFDSGDAMSGPGSQQLTGGLVAPGGTVDVSINFQAPGADGTYRSNWKMRNASGIIFGLTSGIPFYVEIVVATPTAVPPTNTPGGLVIPPIIIAPLLNADFTASYIGGQWSWNGKSVVTYRVVNTGTVALESMSMDFQMPVGSTLTSFTSNIPFRSSPNQPTEQLGEDTLAVGDSAWLNVLYFSSPPSGPSRAVIKLCGLDNLGGFCKEVSVDVTF